MSSSTGTCGKLRVWMLLPNFHPHVGGAEQQCLKLSKTLIAKGTSVTVVTRKNFPNTPPFEHIETVPVRRIKYIRPFEAAVFYWFFYLAAHGSEFDILHVHMLHEHTLGAVYAAKLLGKPVIIKLAASGTYFDPLFLQENGRYPFNRLIISSLFKADRIVSITGSIREELLQWGARKAQIVRIPNGVEKSPASDRELKKKLRQELGLPLDCCIVLRVGTFLPVKDVPNLFQAWDILTRKNKNCFLLSVGGTAIPDTFKTFLSRNSDSVKVLLNQDNVLPYYQAADIFVLPSQAEGLSNALLEAGMSSLPAVVTEVGGNPEIVQNGKNGILVPPGNPEQLARGLAVLLDNPELRKQMGKTACAMVQRFEINHVADQYRALYQELTTSPEVKRPSCPS